MARKQSRDDHSRLLRSAESLGRMIGSLQRQLDIATGRIKTARADSTEVSKPAAARRSTKSKRAAPSRSGVQKKSASKRETTSRARETTPRARPNRGGKVTKTKKR